MPKGSIFCYCCWGLTYGLGIGWMKIKECKVMGTLNIDNYYKTTWSTTHGDPYNHTTTFVFGI